MAKPTTRKQFKDYCLKNKYSKWYFSIVENAIKRNWNKKTAEVYVERHHIIPKSIFQNNNVVCLTAREHFICHLMLTKMMQDETHKRKMVYALTGMKYTKERRKNMSLNCPKNALGKKWYHNPIEKTEKYFLINTQPANFILGRLPK